MRFGPVPLEIYEMAKGESLWLAELGLETFPWELKGFRLTRANEQNNSCQPDLGALSESDLEEIKEGLTRACSMTFDARTRATHGDDWQRANLGIMRYEDMIDDTPDKPEIVEYLRETAHTMRL
jgi:hypothetical protein